MTEAPNTTPTTADALHNPALTIDDFVSDPALLGNHFSGPSWATWKAVLKAAFALPMTPPEIELFKAVAGDREPPTKRVRELWVVAGRRAGKDSIASAITAYFATVPDYSGRLRPGERATAVSLACDRDQARVQLRYSQGHFAKCALLAERVQDVTADGLVLKGEQVEILVHTNNFRSVRGRPVALAVFGECAFYRDESSASPDKELYNAIVPALATLDGMIVGISSPWKKAGLLFEKYRQHFGHAGDVLVIKGTSRQLNPTLDQAMIDAQLAEDYHAAAAEWLAEWRSDITGFLDAEWIERAATGETGEMMPPRGCVPRGAIDPSGGRKDFMTAAIAWRDEERVVVGALRARRPPFDPASVTEEFAMMFHRYGVKQIHSDRYGAEWIVSAFAKHKITVLPSPKTASEIFLEAEPMFAQGLIDVPADRQLIAELRNLERRTMRGGRDIVGHPVGGHDDSAVACCMAAWLARREQRNQDIHCGPIVVITRRPECTY